MNYHNYDVMLLSITRPPRAGQGQTEETRSCGARPTSCPELV